MKTVHAFLGGLLILNASCITIQHTPGKTYTDDVYYSSKDRRTETVTAPAAPAVNNTLAENTARAESLEPQTSPSTTTTEQYKDNNGNTYITNNYSDNSTFDYDDYYDYHYASRLRRFHSPYSGYNYYDGYYTNSYWYSYNPYHWGVSIYSGYSWWGPSYITYSYYPSWYWSNSWCGVSWGWGHQWPYYSGYNHGYRDGYWAGYWDGRYDNYYHNSYDQNSNYYGPRQGVKSNGEIVQKSDFRQKYRDAVALDYKTTTPNIAGPGEDNRRDGGNQITTIKPTTPAMSKSPTSVASPVENQGSNTPAGKNQTSIPVQPAKGGSTKPAGSVVVSPSDNNAGTSPGGSTKRGPSTVAPGNSTVIPSGNGNTQKPDRVNPPKDNTVTPERNDTYVPRNENTAPRSNPKYNTTPKTSEVDVPRQQTPSPAPSRPAYNENRPSERNEARPAPQRSEQRTYTPSNSGGSRSSEGGSNNNSGNAPARRR